MKTIDMHSHFFPREWEDLGKRFGTADWPWMKHLGGGKAMVMLGEREFRPVYSACWDADKRLEEMDRDGARGKSAQPPSHYLDRLYVDSAVFDPRALRLLIEVMGEDRVMLGSDYPFPLGEQRVGKLVRDPDGMNEAARGKLLAGNAQRFLGLQ